MSEEELGIVIKRSKGTYIIVAVEDILAIESGLVALLIVIGVLFGTIPYTWSLPFVAGFAGGGIVAEVIKRRKR
jgi:hypothetical protein